jgi:hypothetical protein
LRFNFPPLRLGVIDEIRSLYPPSSERGIIHYFANASKIAYCSSRCLSASSDLFWRAGHDRCPATQRDGGLGADVSSASAAKPRLRFKQFPVRVLLNFGFRNLLLVALRSLAEMSAQWSSSELRWIR